MKTLLSLALVCLLVSCGHNHGKSVSDKGHKLYYVEPVTEAQAKDVLNWLHEIQHNFGQPQVPFQLSKKHNKYIFKYASMKDAEKDPGNIRYMEGFTSELSKRLGAPVDVILTDEHLHANKKVISSGK
jgi:hypothetical protein